MNVTEAEAKTKWCPFARLSEMGGTYNRIGPAADLYCIGSACMAWRWGSQPANTYQDESARDKRFGGCGLAGAP